MLLDVRTQEEWDEGHVSGAVLLPVKDIAEGVVPQVEKDEEILVYCRSGARAGMAVDLLQRHGFTQVKNIGSLENALQYGSLEKGEV